MRFGISLNRQIRNRLQLSSSQIVSPSSDTRTAANPHSSTHLKLLNIKHKHTFFPDFFRIPVFTEVCHPCTPLNTSLPGSLKIYWLATDIYLQRMTDFIADSRAQYKHSSLLTYHHVYISPHLLTLVVNKCSLPSFPLALFPLSFYCLFLSKSSSSPLLQGSKACACSSRINIKATSSQGTKSSISC